jgi:hypothetical protein
MRICKTDPEAQPIRKERQAPLAEAFGDEIHTDLWGPAPVQSLGGHMYYVTFTDGATRWTQLENLRTKDKAFEAYKAYAAWAQTQKGVHFKHLRSDRGGEFKTTVRAQSVDFSPLASKSSRLSSSLRLQQSQLLVSWTHHPHIRVLMYHLSLIL